MNVDAAGLEREIDELAAISSAPAPAVTRILFSDEDIEARAWLRAKFSAAGLSVREDAVGNLFARWPGSEPWLPAVATGSHTDAIPNAGKFDGVAGVLGALEAVRALQREGFRPRRSIEIIMFTAEEPTRFGLGCLGSRLLSGVLGAAEAADLRDAEGRSFDGLRTGAGCSGSLDSVRLSAGCYRAFLEMHIEQGPLLERAGIDIGAVEKIAAPAAFRVRIQGEGGHAGALLMPARRDASLAAAELALAVERAALESGSADTVGTTGVFRIEPDAINSVPARATLEIDLRDTNLATRDRAEATIRAAADSIAERRRVQIGIEVINSDAPANCDEELVSMICDSTAATGCSVFRMISRAYHDSLFMARVCPTAMLFIPCRNGWSHRPDEFASREAVAKGATVLADALRRLAA
ncbi:MAG: M20 family metallo-hydrolase [Terrimicrobiaceae bacterium]|nr:M20 family metallo-hydrolase [Terrimicrobiaceae bacterium]